MSPSRYDHVNLRWEGTPLKILISICIAKWKADDHHMSLSLLLLANGIS